MKINASIEELALYHGIKSRKFTDENIKSRYTCDLDTATHSGRIIVRGYFNLTPDSLLYFELEKDVADIHREQASGDCE